MADTHPAVLSLAAEIVSAHVSNNAVSADQLLKLINDVHHALATAGQVVATEQPKPKPVVAVTKSVFADHLVCLDCGKHFSMLKRHLMTDHKLSVAQYRQRWRLPFSYPVVSPRYAKTRSALAKKFGLGRKGTGTPRKVGRTVDARRR
jgi:predicted transcriptional regulator